MSFNLCRSRRNKATKTARVRWSVHLVLFDAFRRSGHVTRSHKQSVAFQRTLGSVPGLTHFALPPHISRPWPVREAQGCCQGALLSSAPGRVRGFGVLERATELVRRVRRVCDVARRFSPLMVGKDWMTTPVEHVFSCWINSESPRREQVTGRSWKSFAKDSVQVK